MDKAEINRGAQAKARQITRRSGREPVWETPGRCNCYGQPGKPPNPQAGVKKYLVNGKILSDVVKNERDWKGTVDVEVEFVTGSTIKTDKAIAYVNGTLLAQVKNNGAFPVRYQQLTVSKAKFESSATSVRVPGTPTEPAHFDSLHLKFQSGGGYQSATFAPSDLAIRINRNGDPSTPAPPNKAPAFMHYRAALEGSMLKLWDRYHWTKQPHEW